jgi:acetyl esterase/lipase
MPGLPHDLIGIPLEYFEKALDWLRHQDGVAFDRLAVWGGSRGGELALLLGSRFPALKAVVGGVPSALVWPGVNERRGFDAAWTWRGIAIPFLARGSAGDFAEHAETISMPGGGTAFSYAPSFEWSMRDQSSLEDYTIPVEKIQGPVLLVGGADDRLWPSCHFVAMVSERLRAKSHPFHDEAVCYPGAGHLVAGLFGYPTTFPFYQASEGWVALGGSPQAQADAQRKQMEKVESFLGHAIGLK